MKKRGVEKRSGLLENIAASTFQMEVDGNREVTVEGSKGVLEYSESVIRISAGNSIISFSGRALNLKSISSTALIINGFITSIEFIV